MVFIRLYPGSILLTLSANGRHFVTVFAHQTGGQPGPSWPPTGSDITAATSFEQPPGGAEHWREKASGGHGSTLLRLPPCSWWRPVVGNIPDVQVYNACMVC